MNPFRPEEASPPISPEPPQDIPEAGGSGVSLPVFGTDDEPEEPGEETAVYDPLVSEEEPEDPHGETLAEIRDELAATSTENRRNTRRIFDALKQFGGVLDALSTTVNDIHSAARSHAQPAAPASDRVLDIIELSDRVDRIAAAFAREPTPVRVWWPPAQRVFDDWRADRARLGDAFTILTTHVRSLLKNSGLERIASEGRIFDPSCMRADEVALDASVADHTVLAELLPGWQEASSGRVVRPAHVRVSRSK